MSYKMYSYLAEFIIGKHASAHTRAHVQASPLSPLTQAFH